MKEQYRDLDKLIIPFEAAVGSHYKEFITENGVLKIRESRVNSSIKKVLYYRELNEDILEIIEAYNAINSVKAIYFRHRQVYGNYIIEEEKIYFRNSETNDMTIQPQTIKWIYNANNEEIAYELIDITYPSNDINYRSVNKTFYVYNDIHYPNGNRPHISTGYRGYNEPFEFMNYDPGLGDEQDIEQLDLQETLQFLTEQNVSKTIQNWYINDAFLPPL